MAARLDLMEALLAVAARDDERAAQLLRSLTSDSDEQRQKTARPLLAAGDSLASQDRFAAFKGARPLLELLRKSGSPQSAGWAGNQLAQLDHD